jgi:hypothetical protein
VTFADGMKTVRLDAKAALEQVAARMKQAYDKHARPAIEYAIRNKVYLKSTNIKPIDLLENFPTNAMAHLRKEENQHTNSNSPKPGLPFILLSTSLAFLHTKQQNMAISKNLLPHHP